jgi:hypothetical protein
MLSGRFGRILQTEVVVVKDRAQRGGRRVAEATRPFSFQQPPTYLADSDDKRALDC